MTSKYLFRRLEGFCGHVPIYQVDGNLLVSQTHSKPSRTESKERRLPDGTAGAFETSLSGEKILVNSGLKCVYLPGNLYIMTLAERCYGLQAAFHIDAGLLSLT